MYVYKYTYIYIYTNRCTYVYIMEFSHDAHAFSTPRVSFKVSDLFVELHHGLVW